MSNSLDVRVVGVKLYFLPVTMRVPLKFGPEITTDVTCARAALQIESADGKVAWGWGETPLMAQWFWVSTIAFAERLRCVKEFTLSMARAWRDFDVSGHPMEIGHAFQRDLLPALLDGYNAKRREKNQDQEPMPWLAALVCCSAFDLALHDAYGNLHDLPVYDTYCEPFMNRDLSSYLTAAEGTKIGFHGFFPKDFLIQPPPTRIPAWHLVGGKDLLAEDELTGEEPQDGYPLLLPDWIKRDGLTCLKIKLRGDDIKWDFTRLLDVGGIAVNMGIVWLTADFNCTVEDPAYVTEILDKLRDAQPRIYQMILYVEQPFPYDLEMHQIDVHSVSARKPLFMDESAHDWQLVRLGRSLGWTGVALKTCKTQTGAILSLCWAKAHGMTLMVQDLTNPMLAMIPHALLAANAGTIMGVETNGSQFYPDASKSEARIHPGLYRRKNGSIDLSTLGDSGFGYRLERIDRKLPAVSFEG
ncbi:MAG: mandelate racemase/muconate lactonizing enzyme family protein [Spirochaetaceae bacterium]|nr:MAG: mandelate racemase/muconate lactonizing enzyme family protein [Spirochaetaceae bacterium]